MSLSHSYWDLRVFFLLSVGSDFKQINYMKTEHIDINCDMGESFGNYDIGADKKIFPFITSCNVACGFHAGDPVHIEETLRMAIEHQVEIGAHPSYPDLVGFGRRYLKMSRHELRASIKYQIAAVKGMAESLGGKITYVKPHGALYVRAADDADEAMVILEAVREIDKQLVVMGLAGSKMQEVAEQVDMEFIAEAFADRRYNKKGRLVDRSEKGAVIEEPGEAAAQVVSLVRKQMVQTSDYEPVSIMAKSICIHGDNPSVLHILRAIDEALSERNIKKKSFIL